jgi:hypothetical protein
MTNREIKEAKQGLSKTSKIENENDKWIQLVALAQKLNAPIPPRGAPGFLHGAINDITRNIHITLQTEEMFNACVFAKLSCLFAAVAAIVACVSVVLSVCLN